MSDLADIAKHTQRFRDAVRAFTPPPPKRYAKLMPLGEGIFELREKGASLRLIRELLATVDVAVSIDTIACFLAEANGAKRNRARRNNPDEDATLSAVQMANKRGLRCRNRTATDRTTNSFAATKRSAMRKITHSRSAHRRSSQPLIERSLFMNKQINLDLIAARTLRTIMPRRQTTDANL
jgi:hypothetical protein